MASMSSLVSFPMVLRLEIPHFFLDESVCPSVRPYVLPYVSNAFVFRAFEFGNTNMSIAILGKTQNLD